MRGMESRADWEELDPTGLADFVLLLAKNNPWFSSHILAQLSEWTAQPGFPASEFISVRSGTT